MVVFCPKDPSFDTDGYPESGTRGFSGSGWYYVSSSRWYGPYATKLEAQNRQKKYDNNSSNIKR